MLYTQLGVTITAALIGMATAVPVVINNSANEKQHQMLLPDRSESHLAAPTHIDRPSEEFKKRLQKKLINAPSWNSRQKILIPNPPDATNMVYQFVNNSVEAPTGGTINVASVDQFPALTGIEMSFGVGFINPCGLNVPHTHPRANEFLTVHEGELVAAVVLEENPNGAGNVGGKIPKPMGPISMINATLSNYKGILIPKGLTHFQYNPHCEPAVFTASFDSSDPGRMQIAQTFFSILPAEVPLTATGNDLEILGPHNLERLRNKVPNSFVQLVDECVKKCFPSKKEEPGANIEVEAVD